MSTDECYSFHKGDYLGLDRHVSSIYLVILPSDRARMCQVKGYARS